MSKEKNILHKFEEVYKSGANENVSSDVPDLFDSIISKSSINNGAKVVSTTTKTKGGWYYLGAGVVIATILICYYLCLPEPVENDLNKHDRIEKNDIILNSEEGEIITNSSKEAGKVDLTPNTDKKSSMKGSNQGVNNSENDITDDLIVVDEDEIESVESQNSLEDEVESDVEVESNDFDNSEELEKSSTPLPDVDNSEMNNSFNNYIKKHSKKDSTQKLFKDN